MPFKPSACARACRRRGSSSDGKYVPWRSLGIASSIVPTRVSHSRSRTPLRDVTRLSVRSYGAAPMASVTSTSISSWASSRSPSRRNCGSLPCSSLRSRSKSAILKLVIVVVLPSVDSATHLEPHGGPFCQRARNLHHYLLLNSGQRHRPSRKKKVRKSRWQDEWTISLDHPAGHVVADVASGAWLK